MLENVKKNKAARLATALCIVVRARTTALTIAFVFAFTLCFTMCVTLVHRHIPAPALGRLCIQPQTGTYMHNLCDYSIKIASFVLSEDQIIGIVGHYLHSIFLSQVTQFIAQPQNLVSSEL